MILLFGFKGCGKTSFGRTLSRQLELPFIDTDQMIETIYGTTIRSLYQTVGEKAFRHIEYQALLSLKNHSPAIIALGGGTLMDACNLQIAQELGMLVFLNVPWEIIESRLDPGWPLFANRKEIFDERMAIYQTIPAYQILHNHGV